MKCSDLHNCRRDAPGERDTDGRGPGFLSPQREHEEEEVRVDKEQRRLWGGEMTESRGILLWSRKESVHERRTVSGAAGERTHCNPTPSHS